MKNKIKLLALILLALYIAAGCEDKELGNPPASTVADFSYLRTNDGYAPCEVTFTNKSIMALEYQWNFGNGLTSAEENPTIDYESPGIYTVKLTCKAINDVYYNHLVDSVRINIKDPLAGLSQVLYYTARNSEGGGGHMVILTDESPLVLDFDFVDLSRPYGIAADTINRTVFITDYSLGCIYSFSAEGMNPVRILDVNVPGQEIVDYPEAVFCWDNKLYWGRPGGIYQSNPDGTNPEEFIPMSTSSAPEYPIDMQYDFNTNKIFFVNDRYDYSGGLFSVNFDGSGLTTIIPDIDGTAIEVYTVANKIYFCAYAVADTPVTEDGVYMCNYDGSELVKIGDFGSKATWGMAIDYTRNKLFWSYKISNSEPDGKIIRANLDGSGQEDWLTGVSPHAMQIVWIKL